MEITVTHKYLVFPVNHYLTPKKLTVTHGQTRPYRLNLQIDNLNPDFEAFVDVSRFMGKTVSLSCAPEMELQFREADEIDLPDLYKEELRPQVHYSPKCGYMNDPNGMLYLDGEYHLFYQHNPAAPLPDRENVHWGHAVSRDMFHWEEKDAALFPDERGSMYSGSAVVDDKNILGKAKAGEKTVVMYYTGNCDPYGQYASYTTDGFKTVSRLKDTAVVPHMEGRNRDPNVTWCQELGAYVMVLYLARTEFVLLRSEDLEHWTEVQRFSLPEDIECPDFFPLCDQNGKRKWVFMGGADAYLVGDFADGKFVPSQEAQKLHFGQSAYAGQSFNNMPDGRVVRMYWVRWFLNTPRFDGMMSVPVEITLQECGSKHRLLANPAKEIAAIMGEGLTEANLTLSVGESKKFALSERAQYIRIRGQRLKEGTIALRLFGRIIKIDFTQNHVRMRASVAPLDTGREDFDLTIITDRCSVEMFVDGGVSFIADVNENTVMDKNLPYLELSTDEACVLDEVTVTPLTSIFKEKA